VRFLFGETGTDRFEDLNADVRWTSACRRSRRRQHLDFHSLEGNGNVTNLAGTSKLS